MQNLSSAVLVALGGALVVFGGYHALIIAPQLRRLTQALEAHDALLGGGSGKATNRIVTLETSAGDLSHQGAALEREYAFGVVLQLLGRLAGRSKTPSVNGKSGNGPAPAPTPGANAQGAKQP